jgi:hypothetical protein
MHQSIVLPEFRHRRGVRVPPVGFAARWFGPCLMSLEVDHGRAFGIGADGKGLATRRADRRGAHGGKRR